MQRTLLQASAMTHEAMWFAAAVRLHGIDKANLLARAAARAAAEVEAQRLRMALGLRRVRNLAQCKRFLPAALAMLRAPEMRVGVSFPDDNRMRWEARRCYTPIGAQPLSVLARFQCCVFERIEVWLENLGITHSATPRVDGCLMQARGACVRHYRFSFGAQPEREPRASEA